MVKRLIFFVGVYDTLDIFSCELQREFDEMGYETMMFDSSDMQESLKKLALFVRYPVTAVITFNNLGYNMELRPGRNIWDDFGIYCVNVLMDHPFCYHPALDASPARAAVLCTDLNHMRYIQRFYPKIPITGFLPHAGIDRGLPQKRICERDIQVLYAGGLSKGFITLPDFEKYEAFDAKKIADDAYHILVEHPQMTTETAIEDALSAAGIRLTESELCEIIADLRYVDLLATSYYREKVIHTLVDHGIQVHLYGYGWDVCTWLDHPNLFYGGRISASEILDQMANAKIVLNTMTWFKDGTHDRVFNGMLSGAVAVTDSSVYMKEQFPEQTRDERKLFLFELDQIESLPEMIQGLLAQEDYMQQVADRGYFYAKKYHTWKSRAEELEQDLLKAL